MQITRFAMLWALAFFSILPYSIRAQELITNTPSPAEQSDATATPGVPPIAAGTIAVDVPILESLLNDGDGLEIMGISLERTLHTLERVVITVENRADAPLDGAAWFLLTPAYITEEEWKYAAYTAPTQLFEDLEPGEQVMLNFLGPTDGLLGEFKLSGWVHRVNADGTTSHADGVGYDAPLVIGPPLFMTVRDAEIYPVSGSAGEQILYVTMTLRNYSPQFAEVAYSFSLAQPGVEKPWENGLFNKPYQSLILLPGSELELTTRDVLEGLPDEPLEISAFLQQNIRGTYEFRSSDVFHQTVRPVTGPAN
ncbi:MAG: hypothetical protein IPK19_03565 [Chloroflexi bacterium]|nr:hypothetical protein [Chloroflexota bacterium]